MANFYLPKDSDLALAARGWPGPGVKPTGPVEIDWSNPLARGLVECVVSAAGNELVNLVTQQKEFTATGTPKFEANALKFTPESNDSYTKSDANFGDYLDWTIINAVSLDTPSAIVARLWAQFSLGATKQSQCVWVNSRSQYRSRQDDTTSDKNIIDFGSASSKCLAVVYESNVTHRVFADGVKEGSTACGTYDNSGINGPFYLGNEQTLTTAYAGRIFIHLRYSRALSDVEAKELTRDPYQLLKPANDTPYLITVPDAGGAPTLSAATATSIGQTAATVGCTVTF